MSNLSILLVLFLCFFFSCLEGDNEKKKAVIVDFKKVDIPLDMGYYLKEKEKLEIQDDSIKYYNKYKLLSKKRKSVIRQVQRYLTTAQIKEMIEDSLVYWDEHWELAKKQKENRLREKDSLKNIIHPIVEKLPYGAKELGVLFSKDKDSLVIELPFNEAEPITDKLTINNRKQFFEIFKFYQNLYFEYDKDFGESFYLPKVNTYKLYDLYGYKPHDAFDIDNYFAGSVEFYLRLPNLGQYEVYYDVEYASGNTACNPNYKIEDNCCFTGDYYSCKALGKLLLYHRATRHCILIPVYKVSIDGGLNYRFFYITKNNTILIYEGWSGVTNSNKQMITLRKTKEVNVDTLQ